VGHFHFETARKPSPAMAAGVSDRLRSVEDLVALLGSLRTAEGGKSGLNHFRDVEASFFTNAQMLSLRSLAAILYSAIRLSRAAFLRSPLRSKAPRNTQKKLTNKPANMATNVARDRADSISVSCQQSTPSKARTEHSSELDELERDKRRQIQSSPLPKVCAPSQLSKSLLA
jgi:hypothetical protein